MCNFSAISVTFRWDDDEVSFDFSTLYTTISHSKMKDRLRELVQLCFIKKNGKRRYKYLVLRRDRSYFVKNHWFYQIVLWNWFHETCSSFWLTPYYIFDMFGGCIYQQTVGIPMGANCAPLLATCSFIRMRQISYKGFSRKRKEASPIL